MRIGFIGLGIMGRPMAKHLIDAGHSLTVWNRSQPGIDDVVAHGAQAGASPADVASKSEVVFTMVGDSPDVSAIPPHRTGCGGPRRTPAQGLSSHTARGALAGCLA